MKKSMKSSAGKLGNQKGMTLVEIMIVLVIIAGLASALVTQVSSQLKKAKMNEARIQIRELGKALDMFYADCGFYPPADTGLNALVEPPGSDCPTWGPDPYIKRVPKDPWNNALIYDREGSNYFLMSLGADGREGGSGVDSDITSDDI